MAMYCTACGAELKDGDRFCSSCGKSTSPQAALPPYTGTGSAGNSRRLVRTMGDKKIAGVCGGLALYFGVDATIVRFILLALFLLYGAGLIVYVVGWIVMPRDTDVAPVTSV